jgi:IS30 family transposase
MTYAQLTYEQRYQISSLLKMGHSQTEIANCIDVHKSTISRELKRNRGQRGYRPKQADRKVQERRAANSKQIQEATWAIVEEKVELDWSPEKNSGWLKLERGIAISHESIYQHIYVDKRTGGDLHTHLRGQKKRHKCQGGRDRRGKIADPISIEERSEVVDQRTRLGNWEVDLIFGRKGTGAVVTLTKRKSRFTLLRRVAAKSADLVAHTVIELLQSMSNLETITSDNGKEFANHKSISQALEIGFYFAHPYASWERGTNESTNGLIRQYIPKGYDLTKQTAEHECFVMDRINLRPRKCLDFNTPFEVLFCQQSVALTDFDS